ncbi:hypothetical protein QOZ80_6BG0485440 [Eleusine coracana subsp. coracana]|nr:hypothetical protein QOZ80_6BG0485440 [Eleusine coracana subsp. coracana]
MSPSMRKVRIFCSDPDATDSSNDEDDQNLKKEKKLIGQVLVPLKKEPSGSYCGVSSDDEDEQTPKKEKKLIGGVLVPIKQEPSPSSKFRGVRRRSWGNWQAEIRNPFTKKRECTTHKTEEEASAAYQAKREKYDAWKTQLSMVKCTALSSSSSLSCMSTSMPCKQEEQEAHDGVGVSTETDLEPTEESILDSSPRTEEISVNALLDKFLDSDSAIPADKHSPTDESIVNSPKPKEISVNALLDQIDELPAKLGDNKQSPRDAFPVSDFITATGEPLDDDLIGLADISHLPLPFEDPEFDLDAEPDWSSFDLASIERELNGKRCLH